MKLLDLFKGSSCVNGEISEEHWREQILDLKRNFAEASKTCDKLHLPMSVIQCDRIARQVERASEEDPNLGRQLLEDFPSEVDKLSERILDELGSRHFYFVRPDLVDAYLRNQFSLETMIEFSEATYDMEEAGKCYALGRHTASAFHSIRVADRGIKALLAHYALIPNRNTNEWGVLLQAIKDHQKDIENSTEKDQLGLVCDRIDSLRMVWRNPTMHTELDYQAEQAKLILTDVAQLLDAICAILADSDMR